MPRWPRWIPLHRREGDATHGSAAASAQLARGIGWLPPERTRTTVEPEQAGQLDDDAGTPCSTVTALSPSAAIAWRAAATHAPRGYELLPA